MKISTRILLAFSIVLALSAIDSVSNYLLSREVEQNIRFLNKSQDIIRNSTRLHKTIIETQNAYRGFLLTDDPDFLNSFRENLKETQLLLKDQENKVASNRAQLSLLKNIRAVHDEWVTHANAIMAAKKNSRRVSSMIGFRNKIGKTLDEELADDFTRFDRVEYRIRRFHSNNLVASIKTTHTMSLVLFLLTIVIGILGTYYIIRMILDRIDAMASQALSISRGQFEIVVDTRHDELTNLSDSLNAMSQILKKNITELEKRNAELDEFAYVVSHDLKAPLRGIHNVVSWIEEDFRNGLPEELLRYLGIIRERSLRMENLVNGLLDYARVRKKNVAELTDVRLMIAEIADTLLPANFSVECIDLPTFICDRLKLEQVFTNLISNSVKYARAEKGHITIACHEKFGFYEFSVKDNGVGIAPQFHRKVFEMFQTLRDKDEKESTGIGLAIVKKIVEEQHGSITLNSAPGKGAEFIFTWPAKS